MLKFCGEDESLKLSCSLRGLNSKAFESKAGQQ